LIKILFVVSLLCHWKGCRGVKDSVEYVCLSVCLCLSTCVSQKQHVLVSPTCVYILLIAVAQSFSGGVAIRYVLPDLWMTSCFHVARG